MTQIGALNILNPDNQLKKVVSKNNLAQFDLNQNRFIYICRLICMLTPQAMIFKLEKITVICNNALKCFQNYKNNLIALNFILHLKI